MSGLMIFMRNLSSTKKKAGDKTHSTVAPRLTAVSCHAVNENKGLQRVLLPVKNHPVEMELYPDVLEMTYFAFIEATDSLAR